MGRGVVALYRLVFTVERVEGECAAEHKVGDRIVYQEPCIVLEQTDRVCIYALCSIIPYLSAMVRESAEKDDWVPKMKMVQCPDPVNRVVFEVKRERL